MSPISNLFTPDIEHPQPADSEGSSTEASYCSSAPSGTRGSSGLGCSHEKPPWLGQDASTLRLEARLSAIESTMELRCAALEAKISLLTSTAAHDAEAAQKRMHLLHEAVDDAALKLQQSCDVSVAQTADLSECLRQSSDTQARLTADIDKIWIQLNTCREELLAGGLQRAQESPPSSPSGDEQERQLVPGQKGPQHTANESPAARFSPLTPRRLKGPQSPQTPQPTTRDQADAAGAAAAAKAAAAAAPAAAAAAVSPEAQDSVAPLGGSPIRQQKVVCEPRKSLQCSTPHTPHAYHHRTVTPLRPVVRAANSPMSSPVLALRQVRSQQHLMSVPQALSTSHGASVKLDPRGFQHLQQQQQQQQQQQAPHLLKGSSACCPPRVPL